MSMRQRIISGFAWEGGTKLIVQLLSWVSTLIVARLLAPEDYGVVAISGVFVGVLSAISNMGLTAGLINRRSISQGEQNGIFWVGLSIALGMFTLLFLVAPLIARAYEIDLLTSIVRISGLTLIIASLRVVPAALLMRDLQFSFLAIVNMGGQFVSVATALALAFYGAGPWSLVWAVIASQLFVLVSITGKTRHIPGLSFSLYEIKSIILYGVKIMGVQILDITTQRLPTFIVATFIGQRAAGFYSLAEMLAEMPIEKIGSVFSRISFPVISRLKESKAQAKRMFLKTHRYLMMIGIPILMGLALVADDVVVLFLTDKWSPIVPILQILCVVNIFRLSGMILPYILEGLGRVDLSLNFSVAAVPLLALGFYLGSFYGVNGVAAGWLIVYSPLYLVLLWMVRKELSISMAEFAWPLRAVFVATVLMTLAVLISNWLGESFGILASLATNVMTGAVIYVGTFFLIFRGDVREIMLLAGELRPRNRS